MLSTNFFLTSFFLNILFAGLCLLLLPHPVHSLLLLIFVFLNSAGILIIFNFEFIALLLIIIYVGALAVLFLFVLMMLDLNLTATFQTDWFVFLSFSFFLSCLIFFLTFESTFVLLSTTLHELTLPTDLWINYITEINNCATFGHVLYSYYLFFLLLAGLILLLALLGAVHLTHLANKIPESADYCKISKTCYVSLIK